MKKKISVFVFLLLTTVTLKAQTNFNQQKKWFVGFEIGTNKSFLENNQYKNTTQYGVFSEYYYTKNFSLTIRVKKYEKGYLEIKKRIKSDVIAIPIDLKWEFSILKKLKGDVFIGFAFLTEKNIVYKEDALAKEAKNTAMTLNSGFGFTYFISQKIGLYGHLENYLNSFNYGEKPHAIFGYHPNNSLLNFGIKYRLN